MLRCQIIVRGKDGLLKRRFKVTQQSDNHIVQGEALQQAGEGQINAPRLAQLIANFDCHQGVETEGQQTRSGIKGSGDGQPEYLRHQRRDMLGEERRALGWW